MQDWKTTRLATEIWGRQNSTNEQMLLSAAMPNIHSVLQSGAPASLHFTLHDSEHGFRVAEMITTLAANNLSDLSSAELSLLLLASYCHDIGMSPRREKVIRHVNYLLTGDDSLLSKIETNDLQTWLDGNRAGLTAPVEAGQLTPSGIEIADDAFAYYARSRHNDWSEEYIREELADLPFSMYAGWIDDLVILCRSHHEGISELRQNRFDAKNVGSPSVVVNLRYLAALLRVADILEFAPERTPEVVLNHRDIAPNSRIYWFKDHSISFTIDPTGKQMIFSAQTPSAYIHKAVLDTADAVNDELALCTLLEQENAFAQGLVLPAARATYKWQWPSRLTTDIRELPNKFTYINGQFRPDSKKILKLLSGTALYQNPIVATRELVQNALDAVREQIAYARLASGTPSDPALSEALAKIHTVTVTLSSDGESYWLSCSDDGSGMTKSIIERHLLVSGSGTRGESIRLARAAEAAGFAVERTGRFGIGILSYFMIADSLQIVTRRSQEAGDEDRNAWKFVTLGPEGFGELTRESRASKGTTVSLKIKEKVIGDNPTKWFEYLADYLTETFRWLPCKMVIRNEIGPITPVELGPDWVLEPSDFSDEVVTHVVAEAGNDRTFSTADEVQRASDKATKNAALLDWSKEKINWTQPAESIDAIQLIKLRGSLPYFDLAGGKSYNLFDVRKFPYVEPYKGAWTRVIRLKNHISLHGVNLPENVGVINDILIDTDLLGNADIMVDRTKLNNKLKSEVGMKARKLRYDIWMDFLYSSNESIYSTFNVASAPIDYEDKVKFLSGAVSWCVRQENEPHPKVENLSFPILSTFRVSFYTWSSYTFTTASCKQEAVRIDVDSEIKELCLHNLYGGGNLCHFPFVHNRGLSGVVGIQWNTQGELIPLDGSVNCATSVFPPEWKEIAAILTTGRPVYNSAHPFVEKILGKSMRSKRSVDANGIADVLKNAKASSSDAVNFVYECMGFDMRSVTWLRENHRADMIDIFLKAGLDPSAKIVVLDASDFGSSNVPIDLTGAAFDDDWKPFAVPPVGEDRQLEARERWRAN